MLPGSALELHARLTQAPAIQSGTATTTLTSEAGAEYSETSVIYAPWPLLIAGLFLVLALAYGAWRTARFIRRARHAIAQITENERETRDPETIPAR